MEKRLFVEGTGENLHPASTSGLGLPGGPLPFGRRDQNRAESTQEELSSGKSDTLGQLP